MKTNHNHELEARIDRELKSLPPLAAPPTLAPRVMAMIAACPVAPRYRRAWPTWPMPVRVVSLFILIAAFGVLCAASSQALHAPALIAATTDMAGKFEGVGVLWKAAGLLWAAAVLALKSLGPAFIIGGSALLLFCYAACMGLGTICVRLAYVRRETR